MATARLSPVLIITGTSHSRDVVTQDELKELLDFQAIQWRASQRVQTMALTIGERIKGGAQVQKGKIHFDERLNMATQ